ncbi:hypothetical protein [Desulfovibrio sp. TomC]|uniref:hypothetical protein n=1 Tax=Desulfovibrio sp. TomC TaxID=1562888 RepID=UPI000573BF94|nr:hypothetical protein [Desulfovibrio sp. TomC]KHK02538.1 hypothetical protein NY78_1895 [Desulfovibrio sp. TomC]
MVAKAALAILALTLLLGGCGGLSAKSGAPVAPSKAMPLTSETVAAVRAKVTAAKAKAGKAETRDDYVRLARNVYVAPWAGEYSAAATTEAALAQARSGSPVAREYLVIMVYDIQLQTAMEGTSLSTEDWRAVYVGSGIMSDAAYVAYVDMARGNKVLP